MSALHAGAGFARNLDVTLHVIHVVDHFDLPIGFDSPTWEEDLQHNLDEQREEAESYLSNSQISWTYETARGDPAAVLTRVGRTHGGFFLIGSRKKSFNSPFSRLMYSSSTLRGLRKHADLPIVVIPPNFRKVSS
ncbi:Nucleotide-binding universal stress protein, UspA family [Actinopolyspora mzabensis]|uniref:Nucleotide-binding universal stress protein, UspA family n=1 Tax=Actinopolyspora mzabensis TaxID=995066 RepID=A0A1G9FR80_ACTMZ|nr:universal stress protein [Actinopolyspora mzabensis]SDK90867.1 Nucleotide-binding universal stress protein, UspA family [Actinopolyspora mzabensis]